MAFGSYQYANGHANISTLLPEFIQSAHVMFQTKQGWKPGGSSTPDIPLQPFLLNLAPSWGSARLLHCLSKQRWDQDALTPFLASMNLLLVLCLIATERLWLGWPAHQTHRVHWDIKLPTKKHVLLFHPASNHRVQRLLKQAYLNSASGGVYPGHKSILLSILQMEKLGH